MFERIIVPQGLIELRERACQGEFDALYELAMHVMGVNPVLHSYTEIFALITAILEHAEFTRTIKQQWNSYMMLTRVLRRGYEEGELEHEYYLRYSILYTQQAIERMAKADMAQWNCDEMCKAIQGLKSDYALYCERYLDGKEAGLKE